MANLSSIKTAHEKFLQHLKNKGRSTSTIIAYGKDIEQLAELLSSSGVNQVEQIEPQHIETYKSNLAEKKYTAKSISRKLNSVKTFFRFLKEEGAITNDPAESISHPKYELKPPRILSKMEYRALRDSARDDVRISAVVELLLQTGVRIGELTRIELKDIQEDTLSIRPYESHPAREVPLNKTAQRAIADYLQKRPQSKCKSIFITKTGRPLLVRNIRSSIMRYFRVSEIKDAKINDLRHTFITHQLTSGTPVTILQKIVGHKRLSTTEKYLAIAGVTSPKKVKVKEL